jgi:glycerol-3-phosphate dehydrogenase
MNAWIWIDLCECNPRHRAHQQDFMRWKPNKTVGLARFTPHRRSSGILVLDPWKMQALSHHHVENQEPTCHANGMISATWPEDPPSAPEDAKPTDLSIDVGIIGAGIHGAALARELTLRNVSCALVDKGSVGGGTSQWSTKLFHGGIRYLITGDIRQMREGLSERATWFRIAPHRCRWEAFWMPHEAWFEGWSHRLGIGLYDYWGSDRPLWPPNLKLGGVSQHLFEQDPRSKAGPFRGAVAYADCLTWDQDVVRDFVASSRAHVFDFHEVESWSDASDRLTTVNLRDRRDGEVRCLSAKQWVFALGPWTDEAMQAWFQEDVHRLRLSSGIHLWLDAVPGCEHPWAMRRPKGRILFAIPRDGLMQVGTTEREVQSGWVPIIEAEREELFRGLDECMPSIPWRSLGVHKEELGVRPLLGGQGNTSRLSREAILEQHPRFKNLRLVLGGKLTTARHLMERLATELTAIPCATSSTAPLTKWDGQTAPVR